MSNFIQSATQKTEIQFILLEELCMLGDRIAIYLIIMENNFIIIIIPT